MDAPRDFLIYYFIIFIFSPNEQRAGGGGGGVPCQTFSFSFFPCSADHERDWPPCKVVFFGLATNALNVRNNNNNNNSAICDDHTYIHTYIQYNGGLLPDIIITLLLTHGYYHRGTRLNTVCSGFVFTAAYYVTACMYVCMYGHTYSKSMDQPGKVASSARGQLNREN